jgi:hypothetical protein
MLASFSGAGGSLLAKVDCDYVGFSEVLAVGDINGDSTTDVAVVYHERTLILSGRDLHPMLEIPYGGYSAVTRVLPGDGVRELVLSTVSAIRSLPLPDFKPDDEILWSSLGLDTPHDLAPLPDLTGDSVPDFAAVPARANGGSVIAVLSGLDWTLVDSIRSESLLSEASECAFVLQILPAPDWDDDGVQDLLVSMIGNLPACPGSTHVLSGATRARLGSIEGGVPSFGNAVGSVADLDNDGVSDILVEDRVLRMSESGAALHGGMTVFSTSQVLE